MKLRWISAVLALVALGAVAQNRSAAPPPITVEVVDGQVAVSGRGQRVGTRSSLTWQMATAGYRFTGSGIDFGSAQDQFSCGLVDGGQAVRCTKTGNATGRFAYSVLLVDAQGQAVQTPQPSIWIQGE
jgi:hypothetical protein